MPNTPLAQVPGWSAHQIARLKEASITTAEQVVAIAATPQGLRSLAEHLHLSEAEVQPLIETVRAVLPPATRREMEANVDVSDYGLGVLPPPERDDERDDESDDEGDDKPL